MSEAALPSALTDEDVASLLGPVADALRPSVEAGLPELKALRKSCLAQGIPALIGAPPGGCGSGKCSPKAQLLVREEDVPRVQAILRQRWEAEVRALGAQPPRFGLEQGPAGPEGEAATDGELPCPACGTAAPLVAGACSDCGLQLE